MRAVVVERPGGPEVLTITQVPVPQPPPGWALIEVKAFGINRSEVHFRSGYTKGDFPRIPGIEAAGIIVDCPTGEFHEGAQVVAMMGGMGRAFDGSYAEYTIAPVSQIIPFHSSLPWHLLGAVPEMLQTASGVLTHGLSVQAGQSLLIRGATSSVGTMTMILARRMGLNVIATTRDTAKARLLMDMGATDVVIDDGAISNHIRQGLPEGVDAALELVGTATLLDSIRSVRAGGLVCYAGELAREGSLRDFHPLKDLPRGIRLSSYVGDAMDLPQAVLQQFFDDLAHARVDVPVKAVFSLEQIAAAHVAMESNAGIGKIVVVISPD